MAADFTGSTGAEVVDSLGQECWWRGDFLTRCIDIRHR
jgi:hypothetical protein